MRRMDIILKIESIYMTDKVGIMWFRDDLRLEDNPALHYLCETCSSLVLITNPKSAEDRRSLGSASKLWLHQSLHSLDKNLNALGHHITYFSQDPETFLETLCAQFPEAIFAWNRRYDPVSIQYDTKVKEMLQNNGATAKSFNGALLCEPWSVETKTGGFFKVYTPFKKALIAQQVIDEPLGIAPIEILKPIDVGNNEKLEDFDLLPTKPDWSPSLKAFWQFGEKAAHDRLNIFIEQNIDDYAKGRDFPDRTKTSFLSPHLRFGEISPRQIWHKVEFEKNNQNIDEKNADKYLSEIIWREFAYHLLYHTPNLSQKNFAPKFNVLEWRKDEDQLELWQKGLTGYPIIDAGMRQLWQTGWMHNRVRMIVASFLSKHLLIDWREGEKWFWDTLVDACPANNPASWQWVAGTGADAAPYFRVFNPIIQGEKFDPEGEYVKKWCPELTKLSPKYIHKPWTVPQLLLKECDIILGVTYPHPIIEHTHGRTRALEAFQAIKEYTS